MGWNNVSRNVKLQVATFFLLEASNLFTEVLEMLVLNLPPDLHWPDTRTSTSPPTGTTRLPYYIPANLLRAFLQGKTASTTRTARTPQPYLAFQNHL